MKCFDKLGLGSFGCRFHGDYDNWSVAHILWCTVERQWEFQSL